MTDAGLPGDLIAVLAELFAELRDGNNASATDDVERALGRPPGSFAEFAQAAAASAVWRARWSASRRSL